MKNVLIVTSDNKSLKPVEDVFSSKKDYKVFKTSTGSQALEMVKDTFYSLVVSDEKLPDTTGSKLAENIIKINAMVNTALVSSLSDHDFHEETEGLGVLMKLPVGFDNKKAEELEAYLCKIINP